MSYLETAEELRKSIVSFMEHYIVSMTREVDPVSGKEFNKIHIEAKQ